MLLLAGSIGLVMVRAVRVKMLPYDNKSEFQVVVDMPEGSSLEQTKAATCALAAVLREQPDVTDMQVYVGTSGPINFNGLVRHYFLRQGPNVADIQVNLAEKKHRRTQSHAIAKRVRPLLQPVADRHGARIKVAEVPPGPPVLSTMVAEIYGPDLERQTKLAAEVKRIFESTEGIADVDWFVEDPAGPDRFPRRPRAGSPGRDHPGDDLAEALHARRGGRGGDAAHGERTGGRADRPAHGAWSAHAPGRPVHRVAARPRRADGAAVRAGRRGHG